MQLMNEAHKPYKHRRVSDLVLVGVTFALVFWFYSATVYKVVGWVVEHGWQTESLVLITAGGVWFGVAAHRRGW